MSGAPLAGRRPRRGRPAGQQDSHHHRRPAKGNPRHGVGHAEDQKRQATDRARPRDGGGPSGPPRPPEPGTARVKAPTRSRIWWSAATAIHCTRSRCRTTSGKRQRLELPRIRLHDLRHTHATLALRAGVHPRVVQERLGHANVSITLDTYSHPGHPDARRNVCRESRCAGPLVPTRDGRFCDQFRDHKAPERLKRRPRKCLTCENAVSIGGGGGI